MTAVLTRAQWLAFDRLNPAPTFFARPAWAQALADAMPGTVPAPLRVEAGSDSFLLPLVRPPRGRMPFREYVGFPLGGYTCVLDANGRPAPLSSALAVVTQVADQADHLRLYPWPLGPAYAPERALQRAHETAVIDCSRGFAHAVAGMRGVTRRMAEQANRRGVVCARAEIRELPDYYDLLEAASREWPAGRPSTSYVLLKRVLEQGGDDAQLWFAYAGGRRIAGGIVLFGSDELFFWSAAMDRNASAYRPSNALNVALIRAACERGVHWYNLGASEAIPGLERFKHDLGAQTIPYREVRTRSRAFLWYERARTALRYGRAC
ncbi:MAG TPA: GNAT family N-acetyltransferase [Candidatus Acidoferrales bacterium]|nr:GNAT family N-acetyltransferase [Candidatus Acidoferrales bacterium]